MNMNQMEVIDMPMNDLLKGMGQDGLPSGHPAAAYTIREAWCLRAIMAPGDASKIKILMETLSGLTLGGLYDLKKRYDLGMLTQDEESRIAVMKTAMMQ